MASETQIHPTAVIDPAAEIGTGVSIGPFSCVGPNVKLGDNVRLLSHVVVDGRTTVGEGTQIYPFSSIGLPPQDLKYQGEPSELHIGKNNVIREHVTMNPGTEGGGMVTRVGDGGLFMVGIHVGHDCQIGNNVIMANNATLAGHVVLEDFVIIGGLSAVHQFVRIGAHAMVGGVTGVGKDIIPYGSATGNRANLVGLNVIGMKRRGFGRDELTGLRSAYKELFGEGGTLTERVEAVAEKFVECAPVVEVVAFLRGQSHRGFMLPGSEEADE